MALDLQELRTLLVAGASEQGLTLPASTSAPRLAQALAALANASGGTVLLALPAGSEQAAEAIDRAVQAALSCEPPLVIPLPAPIEIDGRNFVALTVPPGLPHVYAQGGVYWRREGRENVALGPQALRELLVARSTPAVESTNPPGATPKDLDWGAIHAYASSLPSRPDVSLEEFLAQRGGLEIGRAHV